MKILEIRRKKEKKKKTSIGQRFSEDDDAAKIPTIVGLAQLLRSQSSFIWLSFRLLGWRQRQYPRMITSEREYSYYHSKY